MKEIYIGTYPLYNMNVDLFAWPDSMGARIRTIPSKKDSPKICIGFDYPRWEDVFSLLLHETFEFCASFMELQFNPAGQLIYDSSAHLFVFDHAQFTRVCEYQAIFMTRCLPDLAAAYNKHRRKK